MSINRKYTVHKAIYALVLDPKPGVVRNPITIQSLGGLRITNYEVTDRNITMWLEGGLVQRVHVMQSGRVLNL